jgi:hypothetical protein
MAEIRVPRRQWLGCAIFMDSHVDDDRLSDLDDVIGIPIALGEYFYLHRDGGAAHFFDPGKTTDQITYVHRFVEFHRRDGDGDYSAAGVFYRYDAARDVHLGHDPTTKDVPRGVGIPWHGHHSNGGLTVAWKGLVIVSAGITHNVSLVSWLPLSDGRGEFVKALCPRFACYRPTAVTAL